MICILIFIIGHNSVKSVSEVMVFVLCNCMIMLYTCTEFSQGFSKVFKVTDPNSKVDARVVAIVDGRIYGTRNRIPISCHA